MVRITAYLIVKQISSLTQYSSVCPKPEISPESTAATAAASAVHALLEASSWQEVIRCGRNKLHFIPQSTLMGLR